MNNLLSIVSYPKMYFEEYNYKTPHQFFHNFINYHENENEGLTIPNMYPSDLDIAPPPRIKKPDTWYGNFTYSPSVPYGYFNTLYVEPFDSVITTTELDIAPPNILHRKLEYSTYSDEFYSSSYKPSKNLFWYNYFYFLISDKTKPSSNKFPFPSLTQVG